jgi:hypothetical protein
LGSNGVFRIRVVVNELSEVCEEVELEFEGLSGLRCYDALAFLAIRLNGFTPSAANVESKRVLPLLSEAFWIDVIIPHHGCRHEWIGHFASGQREVRKALVADVNLPDSHAIVVF